MTDGDNGLVLAEVRAMRAEVAAWRAEMGAWRAETQAQRSELVASNDRLGRAIEGLEADVAAIMRHLFGEQD